MELEWDSGKSPLFGRGFKCCLCPLLMVKLWISSFISLHLRQKWLNCGEADKETFPPIPVGMHTLPCYSLLHDFPSLPRLKPERQRQVRALWLLASRQMSEQPPGFPYWSFSQAWLLTGGRLESWSGPLRAPVPRS